MLTKEECVNARLGEIFHHVTEKGCDNQPVRCRKSGITRTWKTRPNNFRMPVKYGLRVSFYIDQDNALDWNKS